MIEQNSWKEKQFQILKRLRDLCRENKIPMFLSGDTALAAYRDGQLADEVKVCIDCSDIDRFLAMLDGQKELVCEGMHNNGTYPTFSLRVCDPDTIDFNANNFMQYKYNCLRADVAFIEHLPVSGIKAKNLSVRYGLYKDRIKLRQKKAKAAGQNKLKMAMISRMDKKEKKQGAEAVSGDLFRLLAAGYSGGGGMLRVGKTTFPAGTFDKASSVEIEGERFNLPAAAEKYLRRIFGPNWKNTELKRFEENEVRFRDADFSWKEYRKRIRGIDFEDMAENMKKSNEIRREYKVYNDAIHHYYDILRRTDERIKLWQKYEPRKEELQKLLASGDYEGLGRELDEYLDALDRFGKLELGLCFDPEIFGLAKSVLQHRGEGAYAERLDSLIPEAHRQPLRLMDYRGNYIDEE